MRKSEPEGAILARTDTISSTEKLLDLIRGKQPVDIPPAPAEPPPASEATGLPARLG